MTLDPFGNLWWINQRIEDIDYTKPEEIGQRASTPEAINGILYIQRSLDEALKAQKRFFENMMGLGQSAGSVDDGVADRK